MAWASRTLLILAFGTGLAACGPVQAKTPAPDPPLETPAPPHRVVVPVTLTIPEADPAPIRPVTAAPTAPPIRPPDRPMPPPASPPPAPPADPVQPPALQTTANPNEVEGRTRTLLVRANSDLARVDMKQLSRDAREQYDQARRFIRLAEDALKDKNVTYAKELAEKAAALAALLVKL